MIKSPEAGLKPKDRKLATSSKGKLTANQWQNTPQQNTFMAAWLDPDSPTFGNAHRSALKAGYSANYALQVASVGNQWITDYHKASKLHLEHLEQKLISMINGTPNSKSPDDTKVKAIELIARLGGMVNNNNTTNVTIVQPILGGASTVGSTVRAAKSTLQSPPYEEGQLTGS